MKTFFFDTGVKPHNFTPPVPIMPGHVLRGTIQIPFDCEDVPDNAIFRFACDDPQPMESHIIREIHNSAMASKYAVFLVPDLGEPKNPAAVALGSIRSDKKAAAAKENGKRGGRPKLTWSKAPARGCSNPASELYRYTIVRLSDKAERFADKKPRKSPNIMIWDNRENREA